MQLPPLLAPPLDGFQGAVYAGAAKANLKPSKLLVSGIMAGAFIGYGAYLACTVGGACPQLVQSNPGLQKLIFGAFGLPFGLFMTLLSGRVGPFNQVATQLLHGNTPVFKPASFQFTQGL